MVQELFLKPENWKPPKHQIRVNYDTVYNHQKEIMSLKKTKGAMSSTKRCSRYIRPEKLILCCIPSTEKKSLAFSICFDF